MIPKKFRSAVLAELHCGHQGAFKMKMLAKSYVFWSGTDSDIEKVTKACTGCLRNSRVEKIALHPWEHPAGPWPRVHIDYAGPVENHYLLIVVCAYSKWIEAFPIRKTAAGGAISTEMTIEKLRECFARYGLPNDISFR